MEEVVAPPRVLPGPHFDRWEEALEEPGHRNRSSACGANTQISEFSMVVASYHSVPLEASAPLSSPIHPLSDCVSAAVAGVGPRLSDRSGEAIVPDAGDPTVRYIPLPLVKEGLDRGKRVLRAATRRPESPGGTQVIVGHEPAA